MPNIRSLFPPLRPDSEALLHLDCLRLIAALGIVFYAAGRTLAEFGSQSLAATLLSLLDGFTLWVDLFFVVSGFVISFVYGERMGSPAEYGEFLRKRLARVGPLNWATFLFFLLLGFVSARIGGGGQVSDCAVQNALFLQSADLCRTPGFNHPSWSISAEMGMYLLFPAFLRLGRYGAALFAVAGLAFAALTLAAGPGASHPWWEWTHDHGWLRALPAFLFGMALYQARHLLVRIPFPRHAMGLSLGLFVIGCLAEVDKLLLLPLVYAIVVFAVAADGRGAGPLARLIAPGGQLTYSLYMLHVPVFTAAVIVAKRVPALGGSAFGWWLAAAFLALIPLAYLSYVWFETPARRWIGRRRERGTPAALTPAAP